MIVNSGIRRIYSCGVCQKEYDYIVGMDKENVLDIKDIVESDPDQKVHLLLKFAGEDRSVADPYQKAA